jgi:hypothetical protein
MNKSTKRCNFRFTHEERSLLEKRAKNRGVKMSVIMRESLQQPPLPRVLDAVLLDASEAEGIQKHQLIERILWAWAKPHLKVGADS